MSRHKNLVKNTLILMVGKTLTQFISFFLLPLYTRLISVSDYGTIDLILTYISLLAPVITFQQEMATFRFLVDARNDRQKTGKIIKSSLKSTLLRFIIFAIPYLIACFFINSGYKYLVLFAGLSTILSNLFLQIARGLGKNSKYAVGSALAGFITIAANLFLICILKLL